MPPESARPWVVRLRDMLEAARLLDDLLKHISMEQFASDPHLQAAAAHYIMQIGEAATHVPPDVRGRAPDIPWQQIRGMRNIVVHVYWRVSVETVWQTATQAVPALVAPLRRLLDDEQGSERNGGETTP